MAKKKNSRNLNIKQAPATAGDDPRKRTTGTSLTARGAQDVDKSALTEIGSSRGGVTRDIVPALGTGAQAIRVYDQMANSIASVDVSLRAGKMPIMGAMFFIEPFDDQPENRDISEFVEFNLLRGTAAPFLLVLEDILRMYEYGYTVIEKVYENREWAPKRQRANRRKYTMLKKLAPRPTPTIKKINYDDNGGPISIIQSKLDKNNKVTDVELDISKLVIFSFNKKGGNLEGKSILRTAYQHWYYVDNLYKIDGIQKERHGMGFPVLELPPGFKDEDKLAAETLVFNIRTNEHGGMVLPPGFKFHFAELPGQPVDVMKSIDHHNGMIMLNVMVQFLMMGIQGTGSGGRATAGSHQDMFTKSLRYVGNLICDWINYYLIPQLVAYNFDTDKFPRLQIRNIGETKDLQQWASAVANLAAQNLITLDLETEQWTRSILDAPPKMGGAQTPEANAGNASEKKGDVESGKGDAGNAGVPTDDADT